MINRRFRTVVTHASALMVMCALITAPINRTQAVGPIVVAGAAAAESGLPLVLTWIRAYAIGKAVDWVVDAAGAPVVHKIREKLHDIREMLPDGCRDHIQTVVEFFKSDDAKAPSQKEFAKMIDDALRKTYEQMKANTAAIEVLRKNQEAFKKELETRLDIVETRVRITEADMMAVVGEIDTLKFKVALLEAKIAELEERFENSQNRDEKKALTSEARDLREKQEEVISKLENHGIKVTESTLPP